MELLLRLLDVVVVFAKLLVEVPDSLDLTQTFQFAVLGYFVLSGQIAKVVALFVLFVLVLAIETLGDIIEVVLPTMREV